MIHLLLSHWPSPELVVREEFPSGADSKESAFNVQDPGSSPGSGRFPGEGNGNPLQYSCLENSMDRGAWWTYSPWDCKELNRTEQLSLSLFLSLTHTHADTNTVIGKYEQICGPCYNKLPQMHVKKLGVVV